MQEIWTRAALEGLIGKEVPLKIEGRVVGTSKIIGVTEDGYLEIDNVLYTGEQFRSIAR